MQGFKRNRKTIVLSAFLALALLLGIFPTSQGIILKAEDAEEAEATVETEATEDAEDAEEPEESGDSEKTVEHESLNPDFQAEGLPILANPHTYTVAVMQLGTIKSPDQKPAVIKAEDETNIHFEWKEIPNSAWTEKINIMFSTDSMPDAVIGNVDTARNYESLAPLSELIDLYAPNVQKLLADRPDYQKALRMPDGEIYSLPTGDEEIGNMYDAKTWINTDWLDAVGMDIPETTDEFEAVLQAFKTEDPNGNGEPDEIPFTFRNVWGWANGIENMFGSFGVIENGSHVFVQDGKVTFSPQEDGYYEALKWFASLYEQGLIDPEAFTMSAEQYSSRGANGDIYGVHIGYNGQDGGMDNGENNDRFMAVLPLAGPDGTRMVGFNQYLREEGFSISRHLEDPETLLRLYDYINSSLEMACLWGRGEEGVFWDIKEVDGKKVPWFHSFSDEQLEELGYLNKGEYRRNESFAGQTPALWHIEWSKSVVQDEDVPPNYSKKAVMDSEEFAVFGLPPGYASVENSERRSILLADINTYLQKFIAQSVVNGIDDEDWENHLATLEDLKADEYLELCQEYTDDINSRE